MTVRNAAVLWVIFLPLTERPGASHDTRSG